MGKGIFWLENKQNKSDLPVTTIWIGIKKNGGSIEYSSWIL